MRLINCSILVLFILTSNVSAQPALDWWQMFDYGQHEKFYDAYTVSDSGYIACGFQYSNDNQDAEILVTRMDDNGEELWHGFFGLENAADYGYAIIETDNGSFMIAGESDRNAAALHVNAEGEQIWYNSFGGETGMSVIELKNGEYWICGSAQGENGTDGYIVAFDIEGEVIRQNTYNFRRIEIFISMRETDGGVVLCGRTSGQNDLSDIWVAKVDFDGELVWQTSHSIGAVESGNSIVAARNGGFVIGGYSTANHVGQGIIDVIALKVNNLGRLLWSRTFQIANGENYCIEIERMNDGGFILVGDFMRHNGQLALRLTPDGVERWRATYDYGDVLGFESCESQFMDVIIGHDSSVLGVGTVNFTEEGQNAFIMKLQYEDISPRFISWTPEDTVFSTLLGDTVGFSVQVENAENADLEYLWTYNDSLVIDNDDSATVVFDSLGVQKITCQVSDNGFASVINWHVNVTECYISEHLPDTLEMTLMRDDEIDFSVEVRAYEDIEYSLSWTHIFPDGESELGDDEGVSIIFDSSGEHWVECELNYQDGSDRVLWHLTVIDFRIFGWEPEVLDVRTRRGSSLEFAVDVETVDNVEVSYLWTLSGPDGSEDIGEEADVNAVFEMMGDYQLVCQVIFDEAAEGVAWDVHVYSSIWSWYPEQLDLHVEVDTTLYFHVEASNPESDSLSYQWLVNGEEADIDTFTSDFSTMFNEEGISIISGIIRDGIDADTVNWTVDVFDPAFIPADGISIPESVELSSPVPNPFNAEARINYALPSPDRVSLEIFDLHGRLVDVLFAGDKPAGYHTAVFNAMSLPGGIYLLRLETSGGALTKKALVIK